MRLAAAGLGVGLAALLVAGGGVPAAGSAAQRGGLAPTACTVEPRTPEEIAALVAAATPEPSPTDGEAAEAEDWAGSPTDLQGEPADRQTVGEITAAVREYAGCYNAADGPRWLALMTDRMAAEIAPAEDVVDMLTGATPAADRDGNALPQITAVRVRDVRMLADGRVGAVVVWRADDGDGPYLNRQASLYVFARVGDRWLLDQEIAYDPEQSTRVPAEGAPAAPGSTFEGDEASLSDDEILARAPSGFGEVDSAVYAEPTMMGAQFTVSALLMVGFEENDDYEGVGCQFFVIERGVQSVTVSASCRAAESLVGRAAYLDVDASGPRRSSVTTPNRCQDIALLETDMRFSCTIELPGPNP